MRIVLLGPPGSGKGTQGQKIAVKYGIPQLSTGDILRAAIRDGTELGKKAAEFMNQGRLVTDELVLGVVAGRLNAPDCKNGYVLDGFPRTIAQAEGLEKILAAGRFKLDAIINIDVSDEDVVKRLGGRRQCTKCSSVYHVTFSPPKAKGLCDKCGAALYQRDDDKDATIKNRLKVYKEETAPLFDFYKKGNLHNIDGRGDATEIFGRISSLIDNL